MTRPGSRCGAPDVGRHDLIRTLLLVGAIAVACPAPSWAHTADHAASAAEAAADVDDVPYLPGAVQVAEAVRLNGVPVDIWRLTGASAAAAEALASRQWRGAPSFSEHAVRRWRVIARQRDGVAEVLQYDARRSEALYSRLSPENARAPARPAAALLPSTCSTGGVIEERIAGADVRHVTFECGGPATAFTAQLFRRAARAGFVERRASGPRHFEYARGGVTVHVTLTRTLPPLAGALTETRRMTP